VSGTPITNGLDALKGLAEFLTLRPYCDQDWWTSQVDEASTKDCVETLKGFAEQHMWRR
jgi:hypothetical protein